MPRLIDADALVEKAYWHGEHPNVDNLFAEGVDAVDVSDIEEAPTIEAEPVRHGYWENANGRPKTYIRKCSVCGKEAYFCGRGCSYKFCPNCGADMRGDSDE